MAYVPGFKHDVFISYAHVDNEPLSKEEQGWVSAFHHELRILLARKLGRPDSFSIWRDEKLNGNDEFEDAIDAAYRHSALAVFVLSPGFVTSTWCCRELTQFYSQSSKLELEKRLAEQSRAFKVLLSHVAAEEVPPLLAKTNGYPFYHLDPITGREEPFRRTKEFDEDRRYWSSLDDLARNIAGLLKAMKRLAEEAEAEEEPPSPAAAGAIVYLAEVTDDLETDREDLRRTLEQRGVTVLPDHPLPPEADELAEAVSEHLRRADLSVHMLGSFYGKRPAGETRSYTHVQLDLAADVAAERAKTERQLPRLVWIPRSLGAASLREDQQQLLRAVEEEEDSESPAAVLKIGLEELKETVIEKLEDLFPPPAPIAPETPGALVYISCRPEDEPQAGEIRSLLRSAHHDVVLPIRQGDVSELDKHYQANLQYCDALLVLYASSPLPWVREEILKARRLLAGRRDFLMSVCDGPPPTKEEIGLDLRNLLLLDCREGLRPDRLRPLLDRLGGRG